MKLLPAFGSRPLRLLLLIAAVGAGAIVLVAGAIQLITDPSLIFTEPQVPRPQSLVPVAEPTFGTTLTRIAGDTGKSFSWTGPPSGSGTWGSDVRHHYSKDQPWSSDGTLLMIQNSGGGTPDPIFLDGNTYLPKIGKCSNYSDSDERWQPSTQHPHEVINVRGSTLEWFDVTTCTQTRVWSLPFTVNGFGSGEGNPSRDGRFVVLGDSTRIFVVDMDPQPPFNPYPNKRIGPAYTISACGLSSGCGWDWVTVAASGKYAVVDYNGQHPRIFDIDPNTLALAPHPMAASSPRCAGEDPAQGYLYLVGHADLTMNPFDNNEDVLIGKEDCGNVGKTINGTLVGSVMMVRLRDGAITALITYSNAAAPHHISARDYDRPGWVYVGFHNGSGQRFWDEIVAIKMDGSGAVERLAHKHSQYSTCYRCESHAVPSRDGKRVLFASNWASNCGTLCGATSDIKTYIVDTRTPLPPDTTPPAAPTNLTITP